MATLLNLLLQHFVHTKVETQSLRSLPRRIFHGQLGMDQPRYSRQWNTQNLYASCHIVGYT
jgi:hypothetical protein